MVARSCGCASVWVCSGVQFVYPHAMAVDDCTIVENVDVLCRCAAGARARVCVFASVYVCVVCLLE